VSGSGEEEKSVRLGKKVEVVVGKGGSGKGEKQRADRTGGGKSVGRGRKE